MKKFNKKKTKQIENKLLSFLNEIENKEQYVFDFENTNLIRLEHYKEEISKCNICTTKIKNGEVYLDPSCIQSRRPFLPSRRETTICVHSVSNYIDNHYYLYIPTTIPVEVMELYEIHHNQPYYETFKKMQTTKTLFQGIYHLTGISQKGFILEENKVYIFCDCRHYLLDHLLNIDHLLNKI